MCRLDLIEHLICSVTKHELGWVRDTFIGHIEPVHPIVLLQTGLRRYLSSGRYLRWTHPAEVALGAVAPDPVAESVLCPLLVSHIDFHFSQQMLFLFRYIGLRPCLS